MAKPPKVTKDNQDKRRDEALKNALRMPPKPFTPKATDHKKKPAKSSSRTNTKK